MARRRSDGRLRTLRRFARRRSGAIAATVAVVAAAALVAALLGSGVLAGSALAGDALAIYEPEPESDAVEPGETVAVDVVLRSDGGYAGEGIGRSRFVLAVDPAVAEIESVEEGPFLAGDGGDVDQRVTHPEDGAVLVEQERVGAEDGRTGADVTATVVLRVHEDAPASDAVVAVADPQTHLATGDYRMRSFGRNATVAVAGGGEERVPTYDLGSAESSGDVGVTTAEDVNRSVDDGVAGGDDGDGDGGDDGSGAADSLPGFGVGTVLAALVALSAAVAIRRR